MRAFYSDTFELPLPAGHRFPIDKYRRLRERLQRDHAHEPIDLIETPAATRVQLERVHTREYLQQLFDGNLTALAQRRIGFPWSERMVRRCLHSAGGTLAAARAALEDGAAVHLAGGTHHAFADSGQGFCVFNDVAVATRTLAAESSLLKVVVIDCDVHQGNGTAAIFAHNDSVFTFSMHGENNFPFRKCIGNLDIALADGTDDRAYLRVLQGAIESNLPLSRADCVFYLAGADPYVGDRYGKLASHQGRSGCSRPIDNRGVQDKRAPLTIVMAGGYADNLEDIVDIHARTVVLAAGLYA